ncbi:MAG: hypothetical protein M8860_01290 [marine benthic group bacterium]|nr:hypothetical protein [Candidatus Carthagonibacter metallireducens]MCL7973577.1 hypothetical protein [Gemmatimonadota bacterium]
MRHRLKSAGFLGALLALIGPELAITTATVVLTPAVAEAQVGGVHRRTRRRTRRRTAAVVHTADMNQAAAQQQQQQQQPQADQQSQLPRSPESVQGPEVAARSESVAPTIQLADRWLPAESIARAPPRVFRSAVPEIWPRDG